VFLEKQLAKLQQDIDDHINKHPNLKADRELLVSIPAVGPQVGNHLLAVIHNHQFQSAEQLAAYLGLVPIERQSGTSIRGRPRLTKAGPAKIQAILYMAAIVALNIIRISKRCTNVCKSVVKPKCPPSGPPCVSWCTCFGVLKTRQPYQSNYAI
jgi:transposase